MLEDVNAVVVESTVVTTVFDGVATGVKIHASRAMGTHFVTPCTYSGQDYNNVRLQRMRLDLQPDVDTTNSVDSCRT